MQQVTKSDKNRVATRMLWNNT